LQGRSIVFNDLVHHENNEPWRQQAMDRGFRSSAAFPIKLKQQIVGALNVYSIEPFFFDNDEIELLEEAASNISFAIEKLEEEKHSRLVDKELIQSESRLKTLFATLPVLIWLKDPQGVYLACNPKFENFFGAKESEILGKTDYDFFDKKLAEFFRGKDKKAMEAGKSCTNEEKITYANDGHQEIVETIKTPMFDSNGELIGVLGIARDITERKKSEDKIRKLAQAVEQSPESIIITNLNAEIEYVNKAFIHNSGYSQDEVIGKNPRILQSGNTPFTSA